MVYKLFDISNIGFVLSGNQFNMVDVDTET